MARLLSEVRFGSLLVYSPRGASEVSRRSRSIRDAVKAGRREVLEAAARRALEPATRTRLAEFLDSGRVLVPAPRSAPLADGALWPAERVCEVLVRHGLGSETARLLRRTESVPKSAFCLPGERPTAGRHFATMAAEPLLQYSDARLTLVDDVVTKGSTLLAAASRLAEAYPHAEIRVFALLRTRGLIPEIEAILQPCVGRIALVREEEADRFDG